MINITYSDRWGKKRLGLLFQENTHKNIECIEKTAYQFYFGSIVTKQKFDLTPDVIEIYKKYIKIKQDDIIINGLNLNYDFISQRVGYVHSKGIITSAYICLRPLKDVNSRYYVFLLKAMDAQKVFHGLGTGIRKTLSFSELKNVLLPVPPHREQEQIVRFLDWKVSSINKLINIKQQEITELKELKKATISDAVTHGLDKSVPMKNSGITWLGNIPKHWEILSLKHISRINASIANEIAKLKDLDLVTFLPMENISETGNIDCSIKRPLKEVRSGFSSFSKSDVVIAKITPCFENGKGACLDELDTTIGFGTTELINLRANSRILPKFLYLITVLQEFRKLGEIAMTGSAGQKRVPLSYVKNFAIGIPPIEEQKHILLEVDKRSKSIDECILSKHEELKTLHDLKSSLIADVVTGKIDVRDVEIPDYEQVEETLYRSDNNATLHSEDEIPEEV